MNTVKTGRPLKEVDEGGQATIGLRVSARLKNLLNAAATANSRTLSQEAERRLERSFSVEALQQDALSLAINSALENAKAQLAEQLRQVEINVSDQIEKHVAIEKQLADQLVKQREQLEQRIQLEKRFDDARARAKRRTGT